MLRILSFCFSIIFKDFHRTVIRCVTQYNNMLPILTQSNNMVQMSEEPIDCKHREYKDSLSNNMLQSVYEYASRNICLSGYPYHVANDRICFLFTNDNLCFHKFNVQIEAYCCRFGHFMLLFTSDHFMLPIKWPKSDLPI